MPTRYQDGAAGSHGFGKPDRTCLGIMTRLQDLTGLKQQIQQAYAILGRAARSHGFGTPDSTCLERIKAGLQDLTGKNIRSYMPTRYQGGAA